MKPDAANARKQLLHDLAKVLATPEGRRVAMHYLDRAMVWTTTMTGNSYSYFNEGRRAHGLEMREDLIEADRALYRQAEDERDAAKLRAAIGKEPTHGR